MNKLEWVRTFDAVHDFLHDVESGPTPMGQATIGSLPREATQREALAEFLRSAFRDDDLKAMRPHAQSWADALFDGKLPQVPPAFAPRLREKAMTTVNEGRTWLANLRRSPRMELDALVSILNGRYHVSGLLGDPLRNPASIPSGRNLHDFDTNLIPTRAAWELGKKMAEQTIARFKTETGKFPEKVSFVLWYGETGRSHGATEAEAMYLMGVEPKWNARGVVDGLRLIPDVELKRPRVDAVFTISGIYRDGFGDKLLWLDRAARLAASAGDNVIRKHDREVAEALQKQGVAAEQAEKASQARVFGSAPGMYGVGGIGQIVEQSLDEGKEKGLAEMYLHHMNHAYSEKLWGEEVSQALDQHLKGNQAVIHPRTTFVYGLLDNDDSYQFAGGLNIATKAVNGGVPPQFYINNQRSRGKEQVETFRTFLVKELSTRYWNPKWIRAQQEAGYAGARQFVKEIEHLYGWQAASKEHVDGQLWQKSFDVYVADKHGLGMEEFFEQANPHARQWQLSRLLEVDHQGTYKFSDADRGELIRRYVRSVIAHGAACSANTCGNQKLHEYIAAEAPLVAGLGDAELQAFAAQMAKAIRWNVRDFAAAPAAFRSGLTQGLGQQANAAAPVANQRAATNRRGDAPDKPVRPAANTQPALPNVSGFTMEEKVIAKTGEALSHFINASLAHKFGANIFLRLAGGVYDQPENSSRTPTAAAATQAGGPGTISTRDARNYYGNAQLNWQPAFQSNRHNFVFGTETRQERSDNQEFALPNWQVKDARAAQTFASFGQTFNQAVYGQDTFRLGERVTVVAGLRYDYWRTYDGLSNGFTAASPLAQYESRTNHAVTGKLAGTIIPLGPALQSLLGGDLTGMVNHLVVGFGAVVCGLVLSGIAYYVTLVRERWARVDLKEMEDLCELLMRNLQRRERWEAEPKEARYARIR